MADATASASKGEDTFTPIAVTVIAATIASLTFTFGFGNVWALGQRLGGPRGSRRWSVLRLTCPCSAC